MPEIVVAALSASLAGGVTVVVAVNAAPQDALADRVTVVAADVPEHEPDQPTKVEPLAAAAVSTTAWPAVNEALQVLPQLMPSGLEMTVPLPVPLLTTVSETPVAVVGRHCATTSWLMLSTRALFAGSVCPSAMPDGEPLVKVRLGLLNRVARVQLTPAALQASK